MSTSTNVVKSCICCKNSKDLSEYYKHPKMGDGHLNKCKSCCKKQSKEREVRLRKNPSFVESEKKRGREKYHRLNYKGKYYPTPEKKREIMTRFSEKYPEKIKATNYTQSIKKLNHENQLHHWSYNDEHFKDVIELSVKKHNLLHRFLKYNQDLKMYTTLTGFLLDTRDKHEEFMEFVFERHLEKKSA